MTSTIQTLRHSARATAFSLLELLAVIAIMALLATATAPLLGQTMNSGKATASLAEIAGILEQAREYAVSRKTHVWVAFSETNPIRVTAFASADGSSQQLGPGATAAVPSPAFTQIERLKTLENCRIADNLPTGNALEGTGFSLDGGNLSQSPRFNYAGRKSIEFTRSVMFTPGGEARIGSSLPRKLQVVVVPTRGLASDDVANAAVVQISGLTGRIKVFRP